MNSKLIATLAAGLLAFVAAPTFAADIGITPGDALATSTDTGNLGTTGAIETGFGLAEGSLDGYVLYYKADFGGGDGESFADSYNTVFTPADEPTGATITYVDGKPVISCPYCLLIVKDGNADPAQYLIDLGNWNGTDRLVLSGFWEVGSGAISNVAIWGKVENGNGGGPGNGGGEIPEPASLALLGVGLLAMGWVTRRRYGSGRLN